MIFTEYWKLVVEKYPHLADEEARVQLKVSSLKEFVHQSHGHGVDDGKMIAKQFDRTGKPGDPMSIFEDIFGRRKP
jgi:hypothetical protein